MGDERRMAHLQRDLAIRNEAANGIDELEQMLHLAATFEAFQKDWSGVDFSLFRKAMFGDAA